MKQVLGIGLLALFLMGSGSYLNTDKVGGKKGKSPCKEDIKKFCSDYKKGKGRIAKCLKSNEAKVSDACKNSPRWKKMQHRLKKWAN